MFPLRDNNPSPRFPILTLLLIAANILVFWLELSLGPEEQEAFIQTYAMIPARDFVSLSAAGSFIGWLSPFVASMFLHGGFLHLISNMWSLWIFGDNVEGRMGSFRYLLFYMLTGFAAAYAHASLNPGSTLPVVGASGAISGVMGAYMFLFPRARLHMFTLLIFYPIFFEIPAFVFLVIWFVGQLLSGAQEAAITAHSGAEAAGGIAFMAHIGGFLAGVALLPFFLAGRPAPKPRRRAW